MKQTLLAVACLLLGAPVPSRANFDWFNTETNLVGYADGTTPLKGDTFDSSAGCLVQLVWAGPDNAANPAVSEARGVTGDDQVHASAFVGQASFAPVNGFVVGGNFGQDSNGCYYVRVWSAPSPDYASGLVPAAPTNRYGDSALWLNPGAVPGPDFLNFGGPGNANGIGLTASLVPSADSDADSVPDWWEFLHFRNPTAAAPSDDPDGDGMDNRREFLSGTDPTNAASVFRATAIQPGAPPGRLVRWHSASNRTYDVLRSSSLSTQAFQVIASGLAATPPVNVYTDSVNSTLQSYYSVRVTN